MLCVRSELPPLLASLSIKPTFLNFKESIEKKDPTIESGIPSAKTENNRSEPTGKVKPSDTFSAQVSILYSWPSSTVRSKGQVG